MSDYELICSEATSREEMEEIKSEPVDFVKEFQEYLTQQTQHVNMISGSVCGEKESAEQFQAGEEEEEEGAQ